MSLKLGLNRGGGGWAFNFTKKYAEKQIFKCEIDTTCISILVMLFKLKYQSWVKYKVT